MRKILWGEKIPYLVAIAIIAAALVPVVTGFFYSGNNYPITVVNHYDGNTFSVNLLAYGDTVDYNCSDTDRGIRPFQTGSVSWMDPNADANGNDKFYTFSDFCTTNGKLVELGCVKDFTIDGNQYHNFITAVTVDCNSMGYSCNPIAKRCV